MMVRNIDILRMVKSYLKARRLYGSITGLLMDSGFINEKSDRKAKKVLDIPIDHLYSIIK